MKRKWLLVIACAWIMWQSEPPPPAASGGEFLILYRRWMPAGAFDTKAHCEAQIPMTVDRLRRDRAGEASIRGGSCLSPRYHRPTGAETVNVTKSGPAQAVKAFFTVIHNLPVFHLAQADKLINSP